MPDFSCRVSETFPAHVPPVFSRQLRPREKCERPSSSAKNGQARFHFFLLLTFHLGFSADGKGSVTWKCREGNGGHLPSKKRANCERKGRYLRRARIRIERWIFYVSDRPTTIYGLCDLISKLNLSKKKSKIGPGTGRSGL